MVLPGSFMQRKITLSRRNGKVGSLLQQKSDDFRVAPLASYEERGFAVDVELV